MLAFVKPFRELEFHIKKYPLTIGELFYGASEKSSSEIVKYIVYNSSVYLDLHRESLLKIVDSIASSSSTTKSSQILSTEDQVFLDLFRYKCHSPFLAYVMYFFELAPGDSLIIPSNVLFVHLPGSKLFESSIGGSVAEILSENISNLDPVSPSSITRSNDSTTFFMENTFEENKNVSTKMIESVVDTALSLPCEPVNISRLEYYTNVCDGDGGGNRVLESTRVLDSYNLGLIVTSPNVQLAGGGLKNFLEDVRFAEEIILPDRMDPEDVNMEFLVNNSIMFEVGGGSTKITVIRVPNCVEDVLLESGGSADFVYNKCTDPDYDFSRLGSYKFGYNVDVGGLSSHRCSTLSPTEASTCSRMTSLEVIVSEEVKFRRILERDYDFIMNRLLKTSPDRKRLNFVIPSACNPYIAFVSSSEVGETPMDKYKIVRVPAGTELMVSKISPDTKTTIVMFERDS